MEDQAILKLLQNNQVEGFRVAFDKFYKPLCVQAYLMVKDENSAQDIVQDLFILLWQQGHLQQVQQSLNAYLSTSVRNFCLNFIKKQNKLSIKEKEYSSGNTWVEEKNALELAEMSKQVEDAINELPAQCKYIFELVFIEKLKYQEAANQAGVSINTVKTQLKRGISKLKGQLGNLK